MRGNGRGKQNLVLFRGALVTFAMLCPFYGAGWLVAQQPRETIYWLAPTTSFVLGFAAGAVDGATSRRASFGWFNVFAGGAMLMGSVIAFRFDGPGYVEQRALLNVVLGLAAVAGVAAYCLLRRNWRYMTMHIDFGDVPDPDGLR